MEIKITKRTKLLEINNDMCHNFYYVQYGRIYNENDTLYRQFKFVVWFDIFDVMEYFEKEIVTKREITEYMNEIGWNTCETHKNLIKSFDDCGAFFDWCNKTIADYNN